MGVAACTTDATDVPLIIVADGIVDDGVVDSRVGGIANAAAPISLVTALGCCDGIVADVVAVTGCILDDNNYDTSI